MGQTHDSASGQACFSLARNKIMFRPTLHCDLDAFFASIEQRDNPRLRGKPVVVGGPVGSRGVVATASYEARRFGLHSGMPLFKAQRLCPHGIFLGGNFAKYKQASNQFSKILGCYSPTLEPLGLDEFFVDLSGGELLWGDFAKLALKIKERVKKEIGITVSVGLAWQKTVAKIASGINKPDGFYEVKKGQERQFLTSLPLTKLPGAGRVTIEVLNRFGINKIGQLLRLGPQKSHLLLGKPGLFLWQVAAGQDNSFITPPSQPKSVSRSTTFPQDSKDEDFIKGILFYLCQKVGSDLRSHGVEGKIISLTIRSYQFVTVTKQKQIPPTAVAKEIYEQSLEILEKLWNKTVPLRLVGIGVSGFGKKRIQASLFEKKPFGCQKIEEATDKIRKKFGFLAIQPASILKLKRFYLPEERGFRLSTPALSR